MLKFIILLFLLGVDKQKKFKDSVMLPPVKLIFLKNIILILGQKTNIATFAGYKEEKKQNI